MDWLKVIQSVARMFCRHTIKDFVQELPLPTSTAEITNTELRQLLKARFPEMGALYLSDKVYKLCNLTDILEFLHQDKTNKTGYIAEAHDCDDFSYRLMGQFSVPGWSDLAFGIVWTNVHALNCFVGEDKQFYFVEPQLDTIQDELQPWQGTTIRFIIL